MIFAHNSARSIFLALSLNFNSVISRDCSFVSLLCLFSHTCLSSAILPLSSWVYFFQYFVSFCYSPVCFWAFSSSLWVLSVSLILLLGFPFLLLKSSFSLLFLTPNFLKSLSNNSHLWPYPPVFLESICTGPILLGSYCLGLDSSFFQSWVLALEVQIQLAFFRAMSKLVGRSRLLLGVPSLSLY